LAFWQLKTFFGLLTVRWAVRFASVARGPADLLCSTYAQMFFPVAVPSVCLRMEGSLTVPSPFLPVLCVARFSCTLWRYTSRANCRAIIGFRSLPGESWRPRDAWRDPWSDPAMGDEG
jgi:hypothetical protein